MRAAVIRQYGGPEELVIQNLPTPEAKPGHVVIEIKAFGLNHAELYMRQGLWGDVAKVSGIECVGLVKSDPSGKLPVGQKVVAFMGGMGRVINGSYAEYTSVPASNVVAIKSNLSWEELAAIPECYATAWTFLHGNLALKKGQTLLIRGATSALGQAALNIATDLGAHVVATTRKQERVAMLKSLGAKEVLIETPDLSAKVRELYPQGIDAVLELVGNSTLLDSFKTLRRNGRICMGGFLGGLAPLEGFNPLLQMPSGIHFSFFGSFVFGSPEFPVSEIPLQDIVNKVESGVYKARPTQIFSFEELPKAHRAMEANQANGKMVVRL
jgi:NADPH:quinone reductase-like Zn-dependent oxidoreductase